MATILLVEEHPVLGGDEARQLIAEGHLILRCDGGATPYAACPMLRSGSCPLPDTADLIVYSCSPSMPMRGRTYRGRDLLRAYRRHSVYGRKPMLVVSYEKIDCLEGAGPLARVEKFSSPGSVVGAIENPAIARPDRASQVTERIEPSARRIVLPLQQPIDG